MSLNILSCECLLPGSAEVGHVPDLFGDIGLGPGVLYMEHEFTDDPGPGATAENNYDGGCERAESEKSWRQPTGSARHPLSQLLTDSSRRYSRVGSAPTTVVNRTAQRVPTAATAPTN